MSKQSTYELTGTDMAILALIQRFPFVSVEQLMRLRSNTHLPTFQARMKALHTAGYVLRRRLPRLDRPGNSIYLYNVGTLGARALDHDFDERIRKDEIEHTGYLHLNHIFNLNNILISAYLLAREQPRLSLTFLHDLTLKREYPVTVSYEVQYPNGSHGTETTTIIPDAWLDFRRTGTSKRRVFTVELDMGTIDQQRIRRKLRAYCAYAVSDAYMQCFNTDIITVVYIAQTESRRDLLRSLCESELELQDLEDEQNLFRFGLACQDSIELFCSPGFYRPFDENPSSLLWV